jgi:hypothetical protein
LTPDVATTARGRWRETKLADTEAESTTLSITLVRMAPDPGLGRRFHPARKRAIGASSWTILAPPRRESSVAAFPRSPREAH